MTVLIALSLGGTLADTRADMAAAVHYVRRELKLPHRNNSVILPYLDGAMDQLYLKCFDDFIAHGEPDWRRRYDDVQWLYDDTYAKHAADQTELYHDIAEALARLSKLGRLAVVTNKPEKAARRLLESRGIGESIAAVIGSDTCGAAKPDPFLLQTASRRLHWDGGNPSFMIGGSVDDMKLGRAFGSMTIWCAWSHIGKPEEVLGAIAQHPKDLPDIVRNTLKAAEYSKETQ